MIDKMWVKFDGDGFVKCWCESNRKICPPEKKPKCSLYIVKFIEITKEEKQEYLLSAFKKETKLHGELLEKIRKRQTNYTTQLQRSIDKFKV